MDGSEQVRTTGHVHYERFLATYGQEEDDKNTIESDAIVKRDQWPAQDRVLQAMYSQLDEADRLFESLDTDRDGIISWNEFEEAWTRLGLHEMCKDGAGDSEEEQSFTTAAVRRIFAAMDVNGGGAICRNDFIEALRISSTFHPTF